MLKKLFSSISIYTLASIINSLLGLLILPILTKNLSQEDYGLTALISSFILIIEPLLGMSSSGYCWVSFFKKSKKKEMLIRVFSTYFWFLISSFLFIFILFLAFKDLLNEFLSLGSYLFLIPIIGLLIKLNEMLVSLFINKKKALQFLFYSVIFTFLELSLSYYFIIYIFKSWEGRIIAWLISVFLQSIIMLLIFTYKEKLIRFTFSNKIVGKLLIFGSPLILHQFGKVVVNNSDRIFIAEYFNLEEVGLYNIGYKIGSIILILIAALSKYFTPFLYESLVNEENKNKIVKNIYILLIIMLIGIVFVNLISPYLFVILIDPKFNSAQDYVFIISVSYLFWGVYILLSGFIFYKEKTVYLGVLSIFNIVTNLTLNFILIPIYGPMGACYATLISMILIMAITFRKVHKMYHLPWLTFNK